MAFSLKVTDAKKEYVQADNSDVLEVSFDILEGETVRESLKHSFPLGTASETIKGELQKFLTTYTDDYNRAMINKELEEKQAQTDQAIEDLKDFTI